jgi:hypothetical protein
MYLHSGMGGLHPPISSKNSSHGRFKMVYVVFVAWSQQGYKHFEYEFGMLGAARRFADPLRPHMRGTVRILDNEGLVVL